jgi:hypothetical protein
MMPPFGMHSSEFGSVALAAPKAACCWPDHLPWKTEGAGWSCADAVAASTSASVAASEADILDWGLLCAVRKARARAASPTAPL